MKTKTKDSFTTTKNTQFRTMRNWVHDSRASLFMPSKYRNLPHSDDAHA
jgi:hypothetical protein